jgi:predicted esterase YcpF (UPF0227 family)
MPTAVHQPAAHDAAPVTHLLYLHGFRSSPQSTKSLRMARWVQQHRPGLHWACPALPPSPGDAMALIDSTVQDWPAAGMAVMGSSLGGYYARFVAEQRGCRAVLLNPAVEPARDLSPYVGVLPMYHDPTQTFEFHARYLDELRALRVPQLNHPERAFALIAKGDEVLNWREMAAACAGMTVRLIDGSDHGLSDFDDHLPYILRFLNLQA